MGMNPTFTPVKNSARPTYVYKSPAAMRSTSRLGRCRIISWLPAKNAAMGARAMATSPRYSGRAWANWRDSSSVSAASSRAASGP